MTTPRRRKRREEVPVDHGTQSPAVAAWMAALSKQGLAITSARDGMQIRGWLDSGNYMVNWIISGRLQRGYPFGRTIELFGDPSTGKSYLAARSMAMAQSAGGVVLVDDTEGGYTDEWLEGKIGVDLDNIAYRSSRTVKQHLETAQAFVAGVRATDPPVGLLICDSAAFLSTEHELETQLEKRDMAKAGELRAFFRIIGGELMHLPVVYLATNHTTANIGNPYQKKNTTGGTGLKYHASIRIGLAASKIKGDGGFDGVIVNAFAEKTRFTSPWKKAQIAIPFDGPISRTSGLLPLLVDLGLVEERGVFLWYGDRRIGRAYKNDKHILAQDQQVEQLVAECPGLLDEADALLASRTVTMPPLDPDAEVVEDEAEDE